MITLTINGKQQRFDGDPDMPLLWVLRDELNLKGTKFGCGMGLCGACTIHVNGEPVRSCVMSADGPDHERLRAAHQEQDSHGR